MKRSPEEIQQWLTTKIAGTLGIYVDEIDVQGPISKLGLDSVTALDITGEMGEWLGRDLSPTLLYKYPSIEEISKYLGR
jgi:acyl carrier protein